MSYTKSRTATSGFLLRWCEHNQRYTDNDEESHAHQFSACNHITGRLHPHNGGVGKARLCRECDQSAIRRRVTTCQQQENA
jgi:hypothetical protein